MEKVSASKRLKSWIEADAIRSQIPRGESYTDADEMECEQSAAVVLPLVPPPLLQARPSARAIFQAVRTALAAEVAMTGFDASGESAVKDWDSEDKAMKSLKKRRRNWSIPLLLRSASVRVASGFPVHMLFIDLTDLLEKSAMIEQKVDSIGILRLVQRTPRSPRMPSARQKSPVVEDGQYFPAHALTMRSAQSFSAFPSRLPYSSPRKISSLDGSTSSIAYLTKYLACIFSMIGTLYGNAL